MSNSLTGLFKSMPPLEETAAKRNIELADVFREHGNAYRQKHSLPPSHIKVMRAIEGCRTAALGGHIEQCDFCGHERYFYNSCSNRHCPKCQTLTKEKWIMDRKAELLPVPYFHNVFTLPHELNHIALYNKDVIYRLLFKAVSQTLLEFGQDPKHLGGKPGFLTILHTWDQKLKQHIHLHVVIPAGGLTVDKKRWICPRKKKFLFPVTALSKVFRGKFISFFKKAFEGGELTSSQFKTRKKFKLFIDKLWEKDWVAYSKRPFAGPEKVLDYLGRYTHRVAISNHRILSMEKGQVTFKYRDRKDKDKEKTETISAEEFIRRFLLHILPSRFMRIRHYGFLCNCYKKKNIKRIRELIGEPFKQEEESREAPLERLQRLMGVDFTRCPHCKEGTMVVVKEIPRRRIHKGRNPALYEDTS